MIRVLSVLLVITGSLIATLGLKQFSWSRFGRWFLQDNSYDSYVLATEWTAAVCKNRQCFPNTPSQPNFFNIHGLWPNIANDPNTGPANCNSIPFVLSELPSSLQADLEVRWNGLYSSTEDFLNHEWTKHGTCWSPYLSAPQLSQVPAPIVPLVQSGEADYNAGQTGPKDYMNITLALGSHYSIFEALRQYGIHPSNSAVYTLDSFSSAMQAAFGVSNFVLLCTKNKVSGKSMITEVRICLDLSYQPTECAKKNVASCQSSVEFPLPTDNQALFSL